MIDEVVSYIKSNYEKIATPSFFEQFYERLLSSSSNISDVEEIYSILEQIDDSSKIRIIKSFDESFNSCILKYIIAFTLKNDEYIMQFLEYAHSFSSNTQDESNM